MITDSEVITDLNPAPPDEVGALSSALVAFPRRSPSASACGPYREAIELGLSRGRNAMAIWQDLVDQYGFASSYQSVQRFVRKLRGTQTPEARVVIVTAPGQEAQVDYGTGPMVRDPETRKYRRTRLFVMTLGNSRKAVRLLRFRSSSRLWAELHERAFRRLGGATRIVVLDNLREGVLVPDIYDPALNPLYRDVLAHYGAVAMPCRIQDPDRKGKVESGIGHTQKTPLRGLRFESLEEAQAYLDRWEERWADTRIHGTTKRQVAAMFAEEKPFLLPLPVEPFRYYQYGERIVHLDGCVEVEAAYYGAPPGWIGRMVRVQWDELFVRLLDPKTGQLREIQAFPVSNAQLSSAPTSRTGNAFPYPGATPSISANGTSGAILWAAENSSNALLHAYDAGNLANELYNSNQASGGRDHFGTGNKFITPMITNGKVYVGTTNGVGVFGLLH